MRLRRKLENPMTRKFVSQFAYSHSSPKQDNRMSFRRHIFAINNNKRKTSFRTIPQQPLRREAMSQRKRGININICKRHYLQIITSNYPKPTTRVGGITSISNDRNQKKPAERSYTMASHQTFILPMREARQVLGLGAWGLGGMGVVVISGRPQETL